MSDPFPDILANPNAVNCRIEILDGHKLDLLYFLPVDCLEVDHV